MMSCARSTIGLIAFFLLATAPLACGSTSAGQGSGQASSEPAASLEDLQDLSQLQAMFNKDTGTPRLILLLSPT
jgi:hypothetical protein